MTPTLFSFRWRWLLFGLGGVWFEFSLLGGGGRGDGGDVFIIVISAPAVRLVNLKVSFP